MIRTKRRGLDPNLTRAVGKETRRAPNGVTGRGVKVPSQKGKRGRKR